MTRHPNLSRRRFLIGASVVSVLAATGGTAVAAAANPYAHSTWESLVGRQISVGSKLALVKQVTSIRPGSFRVDLKPLSTPGLTEGLHTIRHAALGSVELFMTADRGQGFLIFATVESSE